MKTRNRGVGYLVAYALVALAFAACGASKKTEAVPPVDAASSAPPATTVVGTIDFMDGEVSVRLSGADWRDAELGDQVSASDAVRTGPLSTCDVGFGPFGLVRLDADSTVELKTVLLSSERNVASVRLAAGSVACKVSKLAGNDRFEVRTQTAVCGVRGTEFLVKEVPGKPMKVAVREGSVAVLPPSFDADALEAAATEGSGEAMVEAVVREIVEAAPLVKANEESSVSATQMAESDKMMAEIHQVVVRELEVLASTAPVVTAPVEQTPAAAADAKTSEAPPQAPMAAPEAPARISAAVTATLVKYTAKAETVITPRAPLNQESKQALEKLPETLSSAPPVSIPKTDSQPASVPVAASVTENAPAEKPTPEPVVSKFSVAQTELVGGIVAAGDRFFVADVLGRLHSFAADGSGKKTVKGDGASNENSRPVPAGGTVYFAGTAALVAFDVDSGTQLFTRPLDAGNSGFFGRRPAPAGGKLFSSSDAGLDVFDAKSGEKLGSVTLSEGSDMTPTVVGDSVYIVTRSGSFNLVSASSHKVLATVATRAVEPIASSLLIVGDRAYFADRKGTAFCIDLTTMAVAWKRQLEAGKTVSVFEDPVASDKAILFFGKSGIYALSAADGSPAFAPVRDVATAPCVLGSAIWYAGKDNSFVALDATTGKVMAKLESGSQVVGRPAALGNRIAFPLASGSVGVVDATRALTEEGKR